ncbi:MAG TPA: VWA domain-containing protein [Terriglobales bacterium]|jgi:VWFA-related protein
MKLGTSSKLLFAFVLALNTPIFPQQQSVAAGPANLSGFFTGTRGTFFSRVEEVALVLSVTDSRGHFVQGLRPSDLTVFDNGQKQEALTFFQSQTDLPLHIALVLDVSGSVGGRFDEERNAIRSFLNKNVRPMDDVMLFAFNRQLEMVAPVTDNWKQVSERVRKLHPEGETSIFDAVIAAARWLERDPVPSRRILILISDGEENASSQSMGQAIAETLKAESSIYSVDISDEFLTDASKSGTGILKHLAEATGGNYLKAEQDGDVSHAFGKITRELRSQYALAYKPSNLAQQIFHTLLVVAPQKLHVRCRAGYYAK